jgi:site-specific recombinase XerD
MGLYKRGQVWWMSFVYKGKRYRKSTETTDRKLALRIFDKIKGEIAENRWFESLPGEKKTFREMMEKFLDEHASTKASYKSYKSYVKSLNPFLGNHILTDITPKMINEYKLKRRNDGVKPGSINRELAILKKAFNLALKEWEWVKENPASKVSMEEENNKRDRWLADDEEERLLEACSPRLRELVIFALNTGMRLSEILALTWRGVDLFRKTITVFKSKNKEMRTLPMNQTIFEMLKSRAKVKSIKTDLVFYNKNHAQIDKCFVSLSFHNTAKKAKVEDFRFHDLRHTFATRLVQSGKDLYKIQRLLGHKTPSMTQRYAHHYPESLRDAVEVLDNRVTNQSHDVDNSLKLQ